VNDTGTVAYTLDTVEGRQLYIGSDPVADRAALALYAHERHGADMLPFPVRFLGDTLRSRRRRRPWAKSA
jgi:hypothetical protein